MLIIKTSHFDSYLIWFISSVRCRYVLVNYTSESICYWIIRWSKGDREYWCCIPNQSKSLRIRFSFFPKRIEEVVRCVSHATSVLNNTVAVAFRFAGIWLRMSIWDVDACAAIIRAIIIKFSVKWGKKKKRKTTNYISYFMAMTKPSINGQRTKSNWHTIFQARPKTLLFFHSHSHWLKMVSSTQIIGTCLCANQTINCINWTRRIASINEPIGGWERFSIVHLLKPNFLT